MLQAQRQNALRHPRRCGKGMRGGSAFRMRGGGFVRLGQRRSVAHAYRVTNMLSAAVRTVFASAHVQHVTAPAGAPRARPPDCCPGQALRVRLRRPAGPAYDAGGICLR